MTPEVLPAARLINGQWIHGWAVHFTPTDPDTSPMQWRPTRHRAERLAARIARRQERDRQWAADALEQCAPHN